MKGGKFVWNRVIVVIREKLPADRATWQRGNRASRRSGSRPGAGESSSSLDARTTTSQWSSNGRLRWVMAPP